MSSRFTSPVTVAAVVLLLVGFATLSYRAVLTKSATYDETLHAVAGHVIRQYGDYRLDIEAPALFLRWGALAHGREAIAVETRDEDFRAIWAERARQWIFAVRTLYETPGNNDGDVFLQRSRAMFVVVAVSLGALIAWWAWRLGGPVTAVSAAFLYALDPNFLAHGALVKNDVPLAFLTLVVAYGLWQLGRRATPWSLALVALGWGSALAVKFSAIVLGVVVALCLGLRALSPPVWPVFGIELASRKGRIGAALALCAALALASWVSVWCAYGFRFGEAPDPSLGHDPRPLLRETKRKEREVRGREQRGRIITDEEADAEPYSTPIRLVRFLEAHRLMPRAWVYGLWYTYASTLTRGGYLMGAYSDTGWWSFFPLAMLFKTPTATLLAIVAAIATWALVDARPRLARWDAVCLVAPPVVYGGSALSANVNIGLRHVLPLYPFLFLGVALGAARLIHAKPRVGATVAGVLALGLAAESLAAWPDYLAFFNVPSGGSRGGIELLVDSNLDWGQDLPLLADWRRRHEDRPLFLSYFGTADPSFYGIARTDMPDGYQFPIGHETAWPGRRPAWVAISATNLKGVYAGDDVRRLYAEVFSPKRPLAILGGSIWVYEWTGTEAVIVSTPEPGR